MKVAVTVFAAFIVTVQEVPEVEVHPVHEVNSLVADGVAVSVTGDPSAKLEEQVDPQLIALGFEVTVPVPVPLRLTVSVCSVPSPRV